MKQKKDISNNWVEKLPVHCANEALFDAIFDPCNSQNDNYLAQKLPIHSPSKMTWENISVLLDAPKQKPFKYSQLYAIIPHLAAASILAFFFVFSKQSSQSQIEILYSEEIIENNSGDGNKPLDINVLFQDPQKFIQLCSNYPYVCKTAEYSNLEKRWHELNRDAEKLEKLFISTNDQRVNQYLNRVISDRSVIENQLLKMFM